MTRFTGYDKIELRQDLRLDDEFSELYDDPSKPEERKPWLFYGEDGLARYSRNGINFLESLFAKAIEQVDSPVDLLHIGDDIRGCERFHPDIKKNLLLNISLKLNEEPDNHKEV